jgi:nicotinamidase-related amidase
LRKLSIQTLVVTGVSTNNSVEATVRMAGNLGFQTYLVADACFTFARRDYHGRLRTADEVHSMSLANLNHEYCIVLDTASVLANS